MTNSKLNKLSCASFIWLMLLQPAALLAEEYKIPDMMADILVSARSREEFDYRLFMPLREGQFESAGITQDGIDTLIAIEAAQIRAQKIAYLLSADLNADGRITREEVKTYLLARYHQEQRIERQMAEFRAFDKNADGVIAGEEITRGGVSSNHKSGRYKQLAELLALDPDKDGILSRKELRKIADEAFSRVDADADGILSEEEKTWLRDKRKQAVSRSRVRFPGGLRRTIPKVEIGTDTEIHVLGVYEGQKSKGVSPAGMAEANVKIDRPHKKVALLLTSYDGIRWRIQKPTSTKIEKIIVSSHEKPDSAIIVNGREVMPDIRLQPSFRQYRTEGMGFRQMLAMIQEMTGKDRIASFHGSYAAPEEGFTVNEVSQDPDLSVNRLHPVKTDKLPKKTVIAVLDGILGEYTLSGTLVQKKEKILFGAAYDATRGRYYTIDGVRGVLVLDKQGKQLEEIEAGQGGPSFAQARGITYNPKNDAIIVSFKDPKKHIYEYGLQKKEWRQIATRNSINHFRSLHYDPKTGGYIGVVDYPSWASVLLEYLDAEGKSAGKLKLTSKQLPGFSDLGDDNGMPAVSVGVDKDSYVIVVSEGLRHGKQRNARRIYYYDRELQKAYLTWAVE